MTTNLNLAGIHGTRSRVVYVVPSSAMPGNQPAWRPQYPSTLLIGGFDKENSTGVSIVECRRW